MSRPSNRTIKNKYAETNRGRQSLTVGQYLEKKYLRDTFSATCLNGQVSVNVNGVNISLQDFNRMYPIPVVAHFNHDTTNIDSTRKWMY